MTPRREQHITRAGLGHILLTGLLGLGAINSQNNLLYIVFGLAATAILVSGVISGSMLLGLRVEREAAEPGQVGEEWGVRYRVRNQSRWLPAFAIQIVEEEPDEEEAPAPGVRWWPAHLARPVAFVAHIGPRGETHAEGITSPHRRGVAGFTTLRAESSFPFGFFRKSVFFTPTAHHVAIIRPRVRPLRETIRRGAQRGTAETPRSTDLPGSSDEFFGLREYAPGDSLRRVAWRRSARTGVLAVREHAAPAPARLWVVLDLVRETAAEPDEDNERAIELAASVAAAAEREGLEVGLVLPSADGGARVRPGAGPNHLAGVLDALAVIDMRAADPLDTADADSRAATLVVSSHASSRRIGPAWATHWHAREGERRYVETPIARGGAA